jgi:hypothetical protein
MKKFIPIAIFALLAFGLKMMAGNVSTKQAEKVAMNFYFERYNMFQGEITMDQINIQSVHTEKDAQQTYYYVFHLKPAGFVIVPADDCLVPVLGYSFEHNYVAENQPPNVQWWFRQYKNQVIHARINSLQAEMKTAEKWEHYLDEDFRYLPDKTTTRQVLPMLTTLWDQGWPYNYYCPATPTGGHGGHVIAGCQATAIAQILYYWGWPEHGQGYTEYIPAFNPQYGLQVADYENTFYRFREMVDSPVTVNTAIAEFIYHVAVNFHTNFDPGNSMMDSIFILNHQAAADSTAFHFKLLPTFLHYRDSMPVENWKNLMLEMLDASAPIFYGGYSNYPIIGHFFVCDGYQDEDFYHFNMGWSGSSNGYYNLNNILDYNSNQLMLNFVVPDTLQFTYPFFCSGSDTLVALEGSITDGSGPIHNYLNNTQASWLIDPQTGFDSVTNIIITVKRLDLFEDGDRLYIYDGEDSTAPLLAELSGSIIPGNITSTGNKMFVEFIADAENTSAGFYLNYKTTQPVWCSGTTQMTAPVATFDDGSGSFNYANSINCKWMINPGISTPLTLNFNYFDTEEGKDILQIVDLSSGQIIASLSGYYEDPPEPVTVQGGKMMLVFTTNNSIQGQGWEAWYDITSGISEPEAGPGLRVYPNPSETGFTVSFSLEEPGEVKIQLMDMMGREAITPVIRVYDSGDHSVFINAIHSPTGVYFLLMQTGEKSVTRKLVKY